MITAKTESGFSIELEESTLDNMEVLDALSDLDEGNPLAMSRLVVKLLGKDGLFSKEASQRRFCEWGSE